MTEFLLTDEERRSNPRFSCVGQAKLICLPSDGNFLPGKIHDLSLGGCCLDLTEQLDSGLRTELLVRIHEASFRALGVVKAPRGGLMVGIEFVQLSSGGRRFLSDIIRELATLRAMIRQLQASKRSISSEAFREQIEMARVKAVLFETKFPFLETTIAAELAAHEEKSSIQPQKDKSETIPRVIPVSLFG